jgi:sugar phosphate isomerase/epimerase
VTAGRPAVLLGTVALEPNRWGAVDPSGRPATVLADWLDPIADAGFDGLELWAGHASEAVVAHPLPVPVFNSYARLGPGSSDRDLAVAWAARLGATGVKCNVGRDPARAAAYAEALAGWAADLPAGTSLLCECHAGTIAEDVGMAARLLAAAGPPALVGAIVHTHEPAERLRARFDAYGDRIRHVHVNHLDGGRAPRLADIAPEIGGKVRLLLDLGFTGTWTLEFVHGTSTGGDRPADLLAEATADLALLRELLP